MRQITKGSSFTGLFIFQINMHDCLDDKVFTKGTFWGCFIVLPNLFFSTQTLCSKTPIMTSLVASAWQLAICQRVNNSGADDALDQSTLGAVFYCHVWCKVIYIWFQVSGDTPRIQMCWYARSLMLAMEQLCSCALRYSTDC